MVFTHTYLRECFEYDPITGVLRWRERPESHFPTQSICRAFNARRAGRPAGRSHSRWRYLVVQLRGRSLRVHRVIWAMLRGIHLDEVPDEIDHIDLNRTNNKESNLREATHAQNAFNRPNQSNNTSGYKGVGYYKTRRAWRSRIKVAGKEILLGYFKTPEEAAAARASAQHMHGDFARLS